MTNKARQRSLQKKNGVNGGAEYCSFCPFQTFTIRSMSINNDENFTVTADGCYDCSVKENPERKCAQAFNRMVRKKGEKQ